MIIKPRRELILSAVVFHAPRSCRDATTGGSRRARRKVLYSLDCHNMSKIDVHWHFLPRLVHYVENNGFEPLTPCLQSRCSSQLS